MQTLFFVFKNPFKRYGDLKNVAYHCQKIKGKESPEQRELLHDAGNKREKEY